MPAAPSLPPAAPFLPSKTQELKQRKVQLTAARKAAAKKLKAKERQMTRLRKHLQKLKPLDPAELVTLAPAVKAKEKAKAKVLPGRPLHTDFDRDGEKAVHMW